MTNNIYSILDKPNIAYEVVFVDGDVVHITGDTFYVDDLLVYNIELRGKIIFACPDSQVKYVRVINNNVDNIIK